MSLARISFLAHFLSWRRGAAAGEAGGRGLVEACGRGGWPVWPAPSSRRGLPRGYGRWRRRGLSPVLGPRSVVVWAPLVVVPGTVAARAITDLNSSSACYDGLRQQQRVPSRSGTAAARAITVLVHLGLPRTPRGGGQLCGALGGECPSPDPCTRAWVWISGVRPLSSNSSCVADAAKTPSPAPSSGGRGNSTVIRGVLVHFC